MISFAGNITFPKAQPIRDAAKEVPLERMLIETDSPFLAPVPHRGKRNEPAFVKEVARQLGEIRGLSTEEIGRQTAANFYNFFKLAESNENGILGKNCGAKTASSDTLKGYISQTSESATNMPENTFDIVSKIDLQEVSNAIQQALKEVHTRFDLKDSKSKIELEGKDAIVLHSIDEYKLKAVSDILQQKLAKRGVPLKGLTHGPWNRPWEAPPNRRSPCSRASRSKRPKTS